MSVSNSEQNKDSQNFFQNPNQILSLNGLVQSPTHTQNPNILRYRHTVNINFKNFLFFLHVTSYAKSSQKFNSSTKSRATVISHEKIINIKYFSPFPF